MDDREIELRFKGIDEKINSNKSRTDNHSARLDTLEQFRSGTDVKIENLIEKINSLMVTMKWFIGLLVGSYVSFFFYAIQHKLF